MSLKSHPDPPKEVGCELMFNALDEYDARLKEDVKAKFDWLKPTPDRVDSATFICGPVVIRGSELIREVLKL